MRCSPKTSPRRARRLTAALLAVALLAAGGCGGDGDGGGPKREPKPLRGERTLEARFAGLDTEGASLGSPRAPYTLVEFADLQCPFCAQFDRELLPVLIKRFVRPGRLRLVLRPVAFLGPDSSPGAAATVAASLQDRAWQFADLFYRNQGVENSGYVTPRFLGRLAEAVPGLDAPRWAAASGKPEVVGILEANARAARTAGITGTPGLRLGKTGEALTPFHALVTRPRQFLGLLERAID